MSLLLKSESCVATAAFEAFRNCFDPVPGSRLSASTAVTSFVYRCCFCGSTVLRRFLPSASVRRMSLMSARSSVTLGRPLAGGDAAARALHAPRGGVMPGGSVPGGSGAAGGGARKTAP